ncbi:MAG TPA: TIGR03067 domain-containing protein [Opitutaceae bacterium]
MSEDMQALQGSWKQIAYERDGIKEPLDEQGWEPRVTFAGYTFIVTLADGSSPIRGTYKIDSTRRPKHLDFTDAIGEDAGKTLLAIYSLEEDQLMFCIAEPGRERPTKFITELGQVLRVNRREAS